MRTLSACFLLLSLFLFVTVIDARRSPGDYWKSIMNSEPMPEAITDLLHGPDMMSESDEKKFSTVSDHYMIRNFDIRPNVILYHNDADSKKRVKTFADGDEDGDDKHVNLKPVVSDSDNSHRN